MAEPTEQTEPKWPREGDAALREVLTSLQPFLPQFGLVPSRVGFFMTRDQSTGFPTRAMMESIIHHERKDESGAYTSAVLTFMEMLLGEEAPPTVLTDFMEALFAANHDRHHHTANPEAWRVHDIIQLACVYLPLQRALHELLARRRGQGPEQQVDVQGVLTQLSQSRLLLPQLTPHVLQTLELESPETAVVHLLASVYATHVEMLKGDYEDWIQDMNNEVAGRGSSRRPTDGGGGGESPVWIRILVEAVEANRGDGFRTMVPDCVFSPETWNSVHDQLAYGRRGRIFDDDDTASESGQSVRTLLAGDDEEDEEENRPPVPRHRLSQDEERRWNMDQQATQRRRTVEYVRGLEIPTICKIIAYQFERAEHSDWVPAANLASSDDLDQEDLVSLESLSTENNSHIPDSASQCGSSSSSNARLHQMRDLTRTLRIASDGRIMLRAYQDELLCWARQGCNVAIFLPTGTGKTFITLRYMQEHLSVPGLNRVVFLAPKVKLAEQQYHRFNEFFPHATYFRCGRSRSSNAPFCELLDTFKVYVMTPQCLVEALLHKEVKMSDFSMLVLDECHHAGRGRHAYKVLMGMYMDAKYSAQAAPCNIKPLPQVIGLTASPGVGSLGSLDSAVSHIRQLCYTMDVEKIGTVRKNKEELEHFINEPQHEIHTCGGRKKDGFKRIIEELMIQIERSMIQCADSEAALNEERREELKVVLNAPTLHRGRTLYHHWVCNLEYKLADFNDYLDTYKSLFSMTEMLMMCQRCLMLNEDCDSQYALEFLQEKTGLLEDQVPRGPLSTVERRLLDSFSYRLPELQQACDDPEDYNPKLRMLEEILLAILEKNGEDCACMVFVRTLELTRAIQSWILRHPQLKHLNSGRITSVKKSVNDGGMKRQDISDVMRNFNLGEHKLVVCTSAAEEGLDFQACNLVVRYDYVTSMISMIQTRGRARRMDSQYCLLGSLSQSNVNREQENLAWEKLMNKAVDQVQQEMESSPNSFQEQKRHWQKLDCQIRREQEEAAKARQRTRVEATGVFKLLCRKCQTFVCMSTDFRLVCESNRAVVAKGFENRWKRVERGDTQQMKHNLEKVAKVHCRADRCGYDWGIVARYTPTGRLLPVLKIESFFLENCATGEKLKQKLKWSQAPFHVPPISDAELAN